VEPHAKSRIGSRRAGRWEEARHGGCIRAQMQRWPPDAQEKSRVLSTPESAIHPNRSVGGPARGLIRWACATLWSKPNWTRAGAPGQLLAEYACGENNVDKSHLGFGPGPIRPDGTRGYVDPAPLAPPVKPAGKLILGFLFAATKMVIQPAPFVALREETTSAFGSQNLPEVELLASFPGYIQVTR
jgi:hypothetical protein